MSTEKNDGNRSVLRVCEILKVMKGHSIPGMTLTDIAAAIEADKATTQRTLQALAQGGMTTQYENKRWGLSVLLEQIAAATEIEQRNAVLRITERQQRIAAGAAAIVGGPAA